MNDMKHANGHDDCGCWISPFVGLAVLVGMVLTGLAIWYY